VTKPQPPQFLSAATLNRLAKQLGLKEPITIESKQELQRARWRKKNDKESPVKNRKARKKRAKVKAKRDRIDSRIPGWEFVQMMADIEKAPPDKLKQMQQYLKKSEDRFRMSRLQRFRLSQRISARLRLCFKRALLA
jgi:hypothetical protein